MKRSAPPRRHANLRPRKAIPKKNGERRKKAFERAYGSKERVEWMQAHGCLACARSPSEVVHIVTGGMGRKADARFTVPLCSLDHHALHRIGVAAFERTHSRMLCGRTLASWAETYAASWEKWCQS